MLSVRDLNVAYGEIQVVWDLNLEVGKGEKVAIVGPNGAGKSTTLKSIVGLIPPKSGRVELLGEDITGKHAHDIVRKGITLVPEGRRLFPKMTVIENLELGAFTPEAKAKKGDTLEWIFQIFPVLKERRNQTAETLSGGEGQMLAIARGLMSRPKLLMLDEPSLGLAPKLVAQLFASFERLHEEGVTILLVEQFVAKALSFAERGYLLERGRIVKEGAGEELLKDEYIRRVYVGG
ncbi:MAG: ABC transporter ATP-binding protein [Candidatus Bathyarchaeia archaeon]